MIKYLLVLRDKTIQSVAGALGKTTNSSTTNPACRKIRIKIETIMQIIDVLDAELVVRTKDGKYEWVICDEDDSQ